MSLLAAQFPGIVPDAQIDYWKRESWIENLNTNCFEAQLFFFMRSYEAAISNIKFHW